MRIVYCCFALLSGVFALSGSALAQDLQVSRYQVTDPTGPIFRGSDITLQVDVETSGVNPTTDAVLTINVAPTMIVQPGNVPADCAADGLVLSKINF